MNSLALFKLYLALFICKCGSQGEELFTEPIHIDSGYLIGRRMTSRINSSIEFSAFTGIPFAEPPIGPLRFQAPVTKKPWINLFNATEDGPICVQPAPRLSAVLGDEDCLYLNVYTTRKVFLQPLNSSSKNLHAVLFWIHGGGFIIGDGRFSSFSPDYLIDKEVVIVSTNYRLGVFGFLSSNDEVYPGNAGLKDIVEALRWVQRNIQVFGGDPKNVAIFGQSAGAMIVHYLMQSPLAKGLFHKAISNSGTSPSAVAFQNQPRMQFLRLVRYFGIYIDSIKDISQFMQYIDRKSILEASFNSTIMGPGRIIDRFYFLPSVEPKLPGAFLTASPYENLKKKKFHRVPYLLGFNSAEGLIFYWFMQENRAHINDYLDDETLLVPLSLNLQKDSPMKNLVSKKIKSFFFDENYVLNSTNFLNFISDTFFVRQIIKTIQLMKSRTNLYAYFFVYKGQYTTPFPGVAHSEELQYLWFKSDRVHNEADLQMVGKMTKMWTNFAKFGNPTPALDAGVNVSWPKVPILGKVKYFVIDSTLRVVSNIYDITYNFWERIFHRYGVEPFQTW